MPPPASKGGTEPYNPPPEASAPSETQVAQERGQASSQAPDQQIVLMVIEKSDALDNKRVAVSEFTWIDGGESAAGQVLSDQVISGLANSGEVTVVERTKLNETLEEQKLGFSGLIDSSETKQVGLILSVDALVMGSIAQLKEGQEIHARLVDVETGAVLGAVNISVKKAVEDDEEMTRLKEDNPEQYAEMTSRHQEMSTTFREEPERFFKLEKVQRRIMMAFLSDPEQFLVATEKPEVQEYLKTVDPLLYQKVMKGRDQLRTLKREDPKGFRARVEEGKRLKEHPPRLRRLAGKALHGVGLGRPPRDEYEFEQRRRRIIVLFLVKPDKFLEETGKPGVLEKLEKVDRKVYKRVKKGRDQLLKLREEKPHVFRMRVEWGKRMGHNPGRVHFMVGRILHGNMAFGNVIKDEFKAFREQFKEKTKRGRKHGRRRRPGRRRR